MILVRHVSLSTLNHHWERLPSLQFALNMIAVWLNDILAALYVFVAWKFTATLLRWRRRFGWWGWGWGVIKSWLHLFKWWHSPSFVGMESTKPQWIYYLVSYTYRRGYFGVLRRSCLLCYCRGTVTLNPFTLSLAMHMCINKWDHSSSLWFVDISTQRHNLNQSWQDKVKFKTRAK